MEISAATRVAGPIFKGIACTLLPALRTGLMKIIAPKG
jgi:hypothetical protein